jgi:hypothetical protein
VLLEKNGRCVALVDEPLALSGSDDMRYRCLGKTPSASLSKGLIFRARLFDRKKAQ